MYRLKNVKHKNQAIWAFLEKDMGLKTFKITKKRQKIRGRFEGTVRD